MRIKGGIKDGRKKEAKLYKKWWFWVIVLIISVLISFTVIMIKAFSIVMDETGNLAIQVQKVYSDATIYSSADGNTLMLELKNWDNSYANEFAEIIKIIKNELSNNNLQSYNKLTIITYLKSSGKDNVLIMKDTYKMPDFSEESKSTYIDYNEYKGLYNTLDSTMDSYTNLFNSIY